MTREKKISNWTIVTFLLYFIVIIFPLSVHWKYIEYFKLYSTVNIGMPKSEVRQNFIDLKYVPIDKENLDRFNSDEGDKYDIHFFGSSGGDQILIYYKNDMVIKKEAFEEWRNPIFKESSTKEVIFKAFPIIVLLTFILIIGILGLHAEKWRINAVEEGNNLDKNIAVSVKFLGILAISFLAIVSILNIVFSSFFSLAHIMEKFF
jgi:hypothetical protein